MMLSRLMLTYPLLIAPNASAAGLPVFDSYLHDTHDACARVPPKEAIAILRKAGLKAAMLSSSSDDGTQVLHAEAPDLVLPVLRPYRSKTWFATTASSTRAACTPTARACCER